MEDAAALLRLALVGSDPDEADIVRGYLAEAFPAGNVKVETLDSAGGALDPADAGAGADVLLVDRSPELGGGVDFVARFRATGSTSPVLFLADGRHPDEEASAIRSGATATVAKPALNPASLRDAVLRAIETGRSESRLRLAEEARRRSEALFAALFSASFDVILLFSPEGTLRLTSPSVRAVLGYETADVTGNFVTSYLAPEDLPAARRVLSELREDRFGSRRLRVRVRRADGDWRIFDAVVQSRLDDPLIGSIVATLRDVTDQARAEDALRRSEEQYRLLSETMKDVVWILDGETLRFRYVSPSVERLRGYSPAEVLAAPVDEALTPDASAALKALIRERIAAFESGEAPPDRYYTGEVEQPCRDGSTVWTEVVTRYYRNPETGRVELCGVTRDISARKAVETALREREERLLLVFDAAPVPMCIFDSEQRIVRQNQAFSKAFGWSPAEIPNLALFHARSLEPEERRAAEDGRRQLLARDPQATIASPRPLTFRTSDDSRRRFEVIEGPLGADRIAILTDVSERLRSEEEAFDRERRYRSIFENAAQGIFLVTVTEDGRLLFEGGNPAWETGIGLRSEDVRGRSPGEILPPGIAAHVEERYRSCLAAEASIHYEETIPFPEGPRTFRTQLIPLQGPSGRVDLLAGLSVETTARNPR